MSAIISASALRNYNKLRSSIHPTNKMKQYMLTTGAKRVREMAASGVIVRVEPSVFSAILAKSEDSVVVESYKKFFLSNRYQYLMFYKGLFLYAETPTPIQVPKDRDLIKAEGIWMPYL